MKYAKTIIKRNEKTVIKVRLDDECKNGHEDFSLTADIYEKTDRGWRESGGGCCHEHILSLAPEFKPFADLHLSTYEGIPMHAAANAWYWFQGAFPECADHSDNLGACHGGTGSGAKSTEECKRIFSEHIRATPAQVEEIAKRLPRSQVELQHALESLGFPGQWKAEAQRAIAILETLSGDKFATQSTRRTWVPLTAEQGALIEERRASGYYLPENVAKRDAEKRQQQKAKKIAAIEGDFKRSVAKLEKNKQVALYFVNHDLDGANVIFYDHTNEIAFNWSSCSKLWTLDEFEKFKGSAVMDELPENVTFKWQERPRY